MNNTTAGITFRETMEGGFALGEVEPKKGAEKGRRDGLMMRFHAEVAIPDVQRFIDDPEHRGNLAGTIDYRPLGSDLRGDGGIFNLFSPTDDPKLKLMVYELGFQQNGKRYYLAGRKEVRQDPGFDLWDDTTTLFARLHEGADTTGHIVGAGVLSLSLGDLLKLLPTIRVVGVDSPVEQAKVLADFGRFFLGDLWDTYGRTIIDGLRS